MRLSVGRWWTFVKPFSIGQARVDENLESDETLAILDNDIDSLEQHPGDCAPEGRLAKLSSPVTATAYGARSGVYCWRATSQRDRAWRRQRAPTIAVPPPSLLGRKC